MTTTNFGPVVLNPQTRDIGPHHAGDAENGFVLTVDRMTASGLDSLTTASQLTVTVAQSNDAGATWQELGAVQWTGGHQTDRHSVLRTQEQLTTTLNAGTSRQVKLTVTIAGTPIGVAGSLVTT